MLGDGPPDGSEFFKSLQRCNEHKHLHANDKVTVEDGGEFSASVTEIKLASEESMMQWRCVDDARKGTEYACCP